MAAHGATYPSRRDEYGLWFQDWLDLGAGVTGAAYAKANNLRADCNGRLRLAFESIDVRACPSMPEPAFPVKPESTEGGRLVSILKWQEGAPLNLG